jgi:hypothetical protein
MTAFHGKPVSKNLPVSIFKANGYNLWPRLISLTATWLGAESTYLPWRQAQDAQTLGPLARHETVHLTRMGEKKIWTDLSKSEIIVVTVRNPAVIEIIYQLTFYYQSAGWNCYCKRLKRKLITHA